MRFHPDVHHRQSIRMRHHSYLQAGAYFITICTHERQPLFGNVLDGKIILNPIGLMVEKCWRDIPQHFPSVELSEFIVMPNHIHGILVLSAGRGAALMEKFSKPVSGSIPTIIRSFKSAATKCINEIRNESGAPVWQRNYYEHLIRNEEAYLKIADYIESNPQRWFEDTYHV